MSIQIASEAADFFRQHRKGRRRLLGITYEFNPAAFEDQFQPVLDAGVEVDIVFGRSASYGTTGRHAGLHPRYWQANWSGTFHPKAVLLLANDKVRLGLGSANLTAQGLTDYLETWRYFEAPSEVAVLAGFARLLKSARAHKIFSSKLELDEIQASLPDSSSDTPVLSTFEAQLASQVLRRVGGSVKRIDIISPVYRGAADVLGLLRKNFSRLQQCHLYGGPDDDIIAKISGVTHYHRLKRPDPDEDRELRPVGQVHAKLVAFESDHQVDVFWGSANFSSQAWLTSGASANPNANIDLLIHSRTSVTRWRAFRDSGLPDGHSWETIEPADIAPPQEDRKPMRPWRLLHATKDSKNVEMEATSDRKGVAIRLSARPGKEIACVVSFSNGLARLPPKAACDLGFFQSSAPPPPTLWWREPPQRQWFAIPVNVIDPGTEENAETGLIEELLATYAGGTKQRRPNKTRRRVRDSEDDNDSPEDRELTSSTHQGEIDRFVLECRKLARAVSASCGNNISLRKTRIRTINAKLDRTAREKQWPDWRVLMIRELLERSWQK